MRATRPVESRQKTKESLEALLANPRMDEIEGIDDMAVDLIGGKIRHPDYLGSGAVRAALSRDLLAVSLDRATDDPEHYARRLAKRGWYVDSTMPVERISTQTSEEYRDRRSRRARSVALETALVAALKVAGRERPHYDYDWDLLPYLLIDAGVTSPDFDGLGVDPTGALERDVSDLVSQQVRGEGVVTADWADLLAEHGWTVDKSTTAAVRATIQRVLRQIDWSAVTKVEDVTGPLEDAGISAPDESGLLQLRQDFDKPGALNPRPTRQMIENMAYLLMLKGWTFNPNKEREA